MMSLDEKEKQIIAAERDRAVATLKAIMRAHHRGHQCWHMARDTLRELGEVSE